MVKTARWSRGGPDRCSSLEQRAGSDCGSETEPGGLCPAGTGWGCDARPLRGHSRYDWRGWEESGVSGCSTDIWKDDLLINQANTHTHTHVRAVSITNHPSFYVYTHSTFGTGCSKCKRTTVWQFGLPHSVFMREALRCWRCSHQTGLTTDICWLLEKHKLNIVTEEEPTEAHFKGFLKNTSQLLYHRQHSTNRSLRQSTRDIVNN